MNFRYASYLILAALPLYGLRFPIFGQATNALEILVVGVLAAYVWSVIPAQAGIHLRLKWTPAFAGVTTLILAATIALFVAPDFSAGFASYRQHIIEPLLFFWMLSREFRGREDAKKLLIALCVPAIPISLIAIAQHYNLYPIPEGQYAIDHRSTSLYSYANAVGLYLAPIVAACAAVFVRRDPSLLLRMTATTTIVLGLPAIFFAQTEAAWLALAATALIAGFAHKKTRRVTLGLVFAGMLALAMKPAIAENVVWKLALQDFSGAVRRTVWHETHAMLADNWFLGAGLSGYQTAMIPYHMNPKIEIFWFPHTLLLNIWVELGLLGLIAFALIIKWYTRFATWFTLAPLLTMLIHGLFDVPFFKPDLALMTACFLAIAVILRSAQDDNTYETT